MNEIMKIFVLLLISTFALTLLPACNTVRGVGEDMAAVGNTLAKTGQ
jgi:predicted small secreted protein